MPISLSQKNGSYPTEVIGVDSSHIALVQAQDFELLLLFAGPNNCGASELLVTVVSVPSSAVINLVSGFLIELSDQLTRFKSYRVTENKGHNMPGSIT
jgi:hypothetical protein